MKQVISKRLISNDRINMHIIAETKLNDYVDKDIQFIKVIEKEYLIHLLSNRLTKDELDILLHDIYDIDQYFCELDYESNV